MSSPKKRGRPKGSKNKGGRPRTYNKTQIEEIKKIMEKYIAESDIPILAEFAYKNDITRQIFYDYPEFSTLVKKLFDKKEAQLEKLALFNVINPAMSIFSLKQRWAGWSDKQNISIENDGQLQEFTKIVKELKKQC